MEVVADLAGKRALFCVCVVGRVMMGERHAVETVK